MCKDSCFSSVVLVSKDSDANFTLSLLKGPQVSLFIYGSSLKSSDWPGSLSPRAHTFRSASLGSGFF